MKTRSNAFVRLIVGSLAFTQFVVGASFAGTAGLFVWKFLWPAFQRAQEVGPIEGPILFVLIAGGFFSLLFGVAGLAVIWSSLTTFRKAIKNEPVSLSPGKASKQDPMIKTFSRSKSSLRFKLSGDGSFVVSTLSLYKPITLIVVLMALMWNGMLALNFKGGASGTALLFVVFQTPFLIIGLGLVALAGYLLLALRHPSIEIRLHPTDIQRSGERLTVNPGDQLNLSWRLKGDRGQLTHLKLWLETRGLKPDGNGVRPKIHTIILADKIDLRSSKQGHLKGDIPILDIQNEELFFACHASAPFAPDVWLMVPIDWSTQIESSNES